LRRGIIRAQTVVSALPIELTAHIAPREVGEGLQPYLRRNNGAVGGALVLFLGVPEDEVVEQDFTHHQLLQDYDAQLGNGNNMFISVSSPGDSMSAPTGFRAVMVSTHCELTEWNGLSEAEYSSKKQRLTELLLNYSHRVFPRLGECALVCELATPQTFERFTHRPRGAVGGFRQRLTNSNQRAVPHASGAPDFWLVGDTTWPGLGTVACVHASRIVAEAILARWPPNLRTQFC
jgi:phytoene dehydrogenase-like protein